MYFVKFCVCVILLFLIKKKFEFKICFFLCKLINYKDTHETVARPLRMQYFEPMPYSSYIPYYTFQTKRIFFNEVCNFILL